MCRISDGEIIKKNMEANLEQSKSMDWTDHVARNSKNEYLARQCLKNGGMLEFSPRWGHCGAQEPKDKKFSKCPKCHKKAYCCRECQFMLTVLIIIESCMEDT